MQLRATIAVVALIGAACSKESADPDRLTGSLVTQSRLPTAQPAPSSPNATGTAAKESPESALAARVGVDPGTFAPEDGVGPEALMVAHTGEVSVRRAGEEAFDKVAGDAELELRVGDQLLTGDDASASLVLADGSRAELAEQSAIAIGDRDADTDPAMSIAVLVGVVRFEVTPRAEGEGPFLVFTPAGIANAVGTAFVVGVSATGEARVGVDEGTVEVAGSADLTQTASLSAAKSVSLDAQGTLSAVAKLDASWGAWRVESEAGAAPAAVMDAQVAMAQSAEARIEADHAALQELSAKAEQVDQEAKEFEAEGDHAGYQAGAAARAEAIEAPFLMSLRLEWRSFAMLAHAHVAHQLYLRHADELGEAFLPNRDIVARAVLYQKRYHVASRNHLRPLRAAYHRHHPRGRGHAKALGVAMSEFYENAKPPAKAKGKAKAEGDETESAALYRPRRPTKFDKKRKVQPNGPAVDWHAKREGEQPPKHAKAAKAVAWYAVPQDAPASLLLRGKPARAPETLFTAHAPVTRSRVMLAWAGHAEGEGHRGRHLALGHDKHVDKTKDGKGGHAKAQAAEVIAQPAAEQAPAVNPAGHVLPKQATAEGNRPGPASPMPALKGAAKAEAKAQAATAKAEAHAGKPETVKLPNPGQGAIKARQGEGKSNGKGHGAP